MEDISELPTDLAISVVPHGDTWKVAIMTDGPQDAERAEMIEAIADIFNLFNALNPGIGTTSNRNVFVASTGAANPNLLQATSFSGDAQRPEQRVGQLGFRFTF